jgi:hypothetical protein
METTNTEGRRNPYFRPDLTPIERLREYGRLRSAGVPIPSTDFSVGDRVRAVASEQGLESGVEYEVTAIVANPAGRLHEVMKVVPRGSRTHFVRVNNSDAVLERANLSQ